MLMRTDPSHHRLYYLSIPRDLQVPIPGNGTQKINAAFQIGGAGTRDQDDPRSSPVSRSTTSIVVNFADFKELIDPLGGIDVDVPKPIRSNRFDCPFTTQAQCQTWQGWRFAKGPQHMNGERALDLLAHPREPARSGRDRRHARRAPAGRDRRGDREVHVRRRRSSSLPFDGGSLREAADDRPVARRSWSQLGWVKFRASGSASVHCRLGGDFGGGGDGSPSEDNPATIAMFLGNSAPQPPTGPFGPGCVTGHTLQ